MKIDTFFTVGEVDPAVLSGRAAVVIDLVRATSVMVEALAAGARAIFPTLTPEDAVKLVHTLGREDTLLCGERKGLKIDGFDLGNSPREFVPEVVRGKQLVMSTTNGTRAFLAASGGTRVYAASLLNLSAVARQVSGARGVALICAGKEDRFAMDDAVCAGLLIEAILEERGEEGAVLDESSAAARLLAAGVTADAAFLRNTAAGGALVEIGLEEDLPFVAQRDRHARVPEMHDRVIRPAGPPAEG